MERIKCAPEVFHLPYCLHLLLSGCWFLMIAFMSCVDYVHRGKEEEKSGEGNVFSSLFSA